VPADRSFISSPAVTRSSRGLFFPRNLLHSNIHIVIQIHAIFSECFFPAELRSLLYLKSYILFSFNNCRIPYITLHPSRDSWEVPANHRLHRPWNLVTCRLNYRDNPVYVIAKWYNLKYANAKRLFPEMPSDYNFLSRICHPPLENTKLPLLFLPSLTQGHKNDLLFVQISNFDFIWNFLIIHKTYLHR
jgi:hypothetical protein